MNSYVESRLDKALCSSSFFDVWDSIDCVAHPRRQSNQTPFLVSMHLNLDRGPLPFRFQPMGFYMLIFRMLLLRDGGLVCQALL